MLPAKLLDYFLRSNKSNINQSKDCQCVLDFSGEGLFPPVFFHFFSKKQVLRWFPRSWEVEDFAVSGTPVPKKSFHYPGPSPMSPNELWTCPDTELLGVCPWLSTALVAGSVRRGRGGDQNSQRRS